MLSLTLALVLCLSLLPSAVFAEEAAGTSNETAAGETQEPELITVSFDSGGGSAVSDRTVTADQPYGDLPTPTREGYQFDGWYTDKTGGSQVTSSTTVTRTASHTLYAHWTEEKPGNSGASDGQGGHVWTDDMGNQHWVPDGSTSGGTSGSSSGSGQSTPVPMSVSEASSRLGLTFSPREVNAGVIYQYDSSSNKCTMTVTNNGSQPVAVAFQHGTGVLATNRSSDALMVEAGGSRDFTYYINNSKVTSGTDTLGVLVIVNPKTEYRWVTSFYRESWTSGARYDIDDVFTVTYDIQAKSEVKPVQITVSFDSNGGSSVSDKTVTVGETYGSLPTPAREGCTFDGWYTSKTGGSKVTDFTTVSDEFNHTLYAHWTEKKPDQINVYFSSDGGVSIPHQAFSLGEPYGTLPTPTRDGYTFDGWFTEYSGGDRVTSGTIVRADEDGSVTLYARWTQGKPEPGTAPSDWAQAEVQRAIDTGILLSELQNNYQQPITRAEFCQLADFLWYKTIGNFPLVYSEPFADTADSHVRNMAGAGVVMGIGDNKFDPDGQLTREQAAAILARLGDAINDYLYQEHIIPAGTAGFADNASISDWALGDVGRISAAGIMQGTGDNMFSPQLSYSREQAVATIMRLYDLLNN